MTSQFKSISEDKSLPTIYSIDTTYLLAANSALHPTKVSGLRDKEYESALRTLLTYLCNGKKFHYVRPRASEERITPFPILKLLKDSQEWVRTVPLTTEGTEENYRLAVEDFIDYIKFGESRDVLDWVRFQFDDDVNVNVFFDSGEDIQARKLMTARNKLRTSERFKELLSLWERTGGNQIELRGEHRHVANNDFRTIGEYSIAYAFFGFAKAQFYSLQLEDEQRQCLHWLREVACDKLARRLRVSGGRLSAEREKNRADPPATGICFDWGSILLELAKKGQRVLCDAKLNETVNIIRERTTPEILGSLLNAGSGKTGRDAEKAIEHECWDFAIDTLQATEWEPEPIDGKQYTTRAKAMAGVLAGIIAAVPFEIAYGAPGALGGFLGGCMISGAKLTEFFVQTNWYIKRDFDMTRKLFREKLFKRFDGTAIAPAVEKFIRETTKR